MAILSAIYMIFVTKEISNQGTGVVIISDSLNSIHIIDKYIRSQHDLISAKDLHCHLDILLPVSPHLQEIILLKVEGHSGDYYNSIADHLAYEAFIQRHPRSALDNCFANQGVISRRPNLILFSNSNIQLNKKTMQSLFLCFTGIHTNIRNYILRARLRQMEG
eukprot:NODE_615_length_5377_cov_0.537514.p2 type:complete len:163 gc:universal NODE_615_length_5377_cov_0.537514:2092-1604(-)